MTRNEDAPGVSGNSPEGSDRNNLEIAPSGHDATTESAFSQGSAGAAALAYAQMGWYVFPCHGAIGRECTCPAGATCKAPGKHPHSSNGFKDATLDVVQINAWWTAHPDDNTGVYCAGSQLLVIDIDPRNGGDESYARLEDLMEYCIPDTVEARTGRAGVNRGRHLYFRVPTGVRFRKKHPDLPGIDFQFEAYVIAPPSRHASGVSYEWAPGKAPWEIELAEMPQRLIEDLNTGKSADRLVGADATSRTSEELEGFLRAANSSTPYGESALVQELDSLSKVREGNRNNALYAAALRLGELVAGGQLDGDAVASSLLQAGLNLGLEASEIQNTVFRPGGALDRGTQQPRSPYQHDVSSVAYLTDPVIVHDGNLSPDESESDDVFRKANILDLEALFMTEEPEEDWFVPGFICTKRGHSLYSDAGVGKSLLMREIAAALASGRGVLGFPPRENPVKVLYFDYENNPHGDIKKSLLAMGFSHEELMENLVISSFPDFEPLDTERGSADFIQLIDQIRPELVIIDTVSRVVEGKENENDTWNKFYRLVGKELKAREIASVRLDHEGKNNQAGARGASAKRGDVDLVWHMVRSLGSFKLVNEKSRGTGAMTSAYMERRPSPHLHHVFTRMDFPTESGEAQKSPYDIALAALKVIVDENEGQLPGQDACWSGLPGIVKAQNVTKRVMEAAHRDLKVTMKLPPEQEVAQ